MKNTLRNETINHLFIAKKPLMLRIVFTVLLYVFAAIPSFAATYDCNKIVSACENAVDSYYPRGYCLAWVCDMFDETYGYESTACCAKKYADSYTDSKDRNTIPLGADVFFSANNAVCGNCGRNCGHIGIYVGNGYIVHNWAGVIRKMKITEVESSGYRFIGWGYHANKSLTGSTSAATTKSSVKLGGSTPNIALDKYYNIINLKSKKYLNVSYSSSGNGVNIDIYEKDGTSGEKFKLSSVNSWFTITPACATKYRVNVYEETTSKENSNICLWQNTGHDTQGWILEAVENGYIIRSANNPSLVMTAAGSSNCSNVKLTKYSPGNKYQIWDFKAV